MGRPVSVASVEPAAIGDLSLRSVETSILRGHRAENRIIQLVIGGDASWSCEVVDLKRRRAKAGNPLAWK